MAFSAISLRLAPPPLSPAVRRSVPRRAIRAACYDGDMIQANERHIASIETAQQAYDTGAGSPWGGLAAPAQRTMRQVSNQQLAVAQGKLGLLQAEGAWEQFFDEPYIPYEIAQESIEKIRGASVPPLMVGRQEMLGGTWSLFRATCPDRFGRVSLSTLTRGLHGTEGLHVNVQEVLRTFWGDEHFSDVMRFSEGHVTVDGDVRLRNPTTLGLEPKFVSIVRGDSCTMHALRDAPAVSMPVCFADHEVILEGGHLSPAHSIVGWRRG